jgi:thiol-disulfide isomerase/thioredoxin
MFALTAGAVVQADDEPQFNPMREWSNAEQTKTFKGKVLKYDGSNVTISRIGKSPFTMSVDKLSEDDKQWLDDNSEFIGKTSDEVKKLLAAQGPVANQLKKAKFLAEKANTSAQYYIILFSASWCGPCNKEAPQVVELYDSKISDDPNTELVMASCDQSKDAAKEWAKKMGMKYPILMRDEWQKIDAIAENSPQGIPTAVLVDIKGKVLVPHSLPAGCYDYYKSHGKSASRSADRSSSRSK